MLCRVILHKQTRVSLEDITKEEKSFNLSDPEPDLNNKNTTNNISHSIVISQIKVARSQKLLPVLLKLKPHIRKTFKKILLFKSISLVWVGLHLLNCLLDYIKMKLKYKIYNSVAGELMIMLVVVDCWW